MYLYVGHFENITWNRVKMRLVCYPFWIDFNFRIEVRSPSNGSATSFNSFSIFNCNKYNSKLRFKVAAFTRKLRPNAAKLFIYYWHNISLALEKIRIPSTCPHDFVNTKLKALFIDFFLLIVDISQQKLSTISFIYACILALRLRYTIEEHSLVVFTSGSGET